MMDSSPSEAEQPHLQLQPPPEESMESLLINEPSTTSTSFSAYRSAMSSLSDSHHPLSPPQQDHHHHHHPNPNSPQSSSHQESPLHSESEVVFINGNGVDLESEGETSNRDFSSSRSRSRSRSASSSCSSSDYLKISVSDPQKEQETSTSLVPGGNTFMTYQITTTTNIPEFGGSEFKVRRRFRDVVTLSDRLSESYRGFFIPPRPDKNTVESQVMQKQEFVEQRRIALEKYLCRLAAHPVIKKSDELKVFLKVEGKLPLLTNTDVASRMLDGAVNLPRQLLSDSASVVALHEVVQPAKGGRDLLRMFRELKQTVANEWGGARPAVVEEDKEFMEKKEKLHDLEQQLINVSQKAEGLVKSQQDIGETMGALGLAFIKLTKFENEAPAYGSQRMRAADMKCLATASVKASRLYRESNSQTVKHLDILHQYLGVMLAVQNAFSDRTSALLTVQTVISELASLNSRAEKLEVASSKLFGVDKSKVRKIEELKETIKVTEDAKRCAIGEYERIKENNRSELERLDRERNQDFLSMLKGFVVNQVAYAEKIANVWAKVAEETSGYAKERS